MEETNTEKNTFISVSPKGLGGWLILVGLGIIVSPVKIIYELYNTYVPVFTKGTWSILTTPGTKSYIRAWGPLLIFEIVVNVCLIALWIYIGYLYFSKKYRFKNWYIGTLLITLLVPIVDSIATGILLPQLTELAFKLETQTFRQIIITGIWIAYILKSARVRNTFVN